MTTTPLGHRIASRRKRAGLTQKALAAQLGMTISQISRLEQGRRIPPIPTLFALARACGTTASSMLAGLDP